MQAAFEAKAICGARFATLCTSIRTFPDGTSDVVTYDYITETATGDTDLPWKGVTYFCLEEFLDSFLELSASLKGNAKKLPVTAATRRASPPPSSYIDDPVDYNEGNEPWMLDSGTTFHIISQDTVDKRGYKMVQLSKPVSFNTASGQAWASCVAEFDLPGADQPLHAFVLPTCAPCLLSICQLTLHEGFGWICPPGKRPFLIRPDGGVIECFIRNGVPYVDWLQSRCQPRFGTDVPKWLRIVQPDGGLYGAVVAKFHLGRRRPREDQDLYAGCIIPLDPGDEDENDGDVHLCDIAVEGPREVSLSMTGCGGHQVGSLPPDAAGVVIATSI
jgi:hypothetical protein